MPDHHVGLTDGLGGWPVKFSLMARGEFIRPPSSITGAPSSRRVPPGRPCRPRCAHARQITGVCAATSIFAALSAASGHPPAGQPRQLRNGARFFLDRLFPQFAIGVIIVGA